MWLGYVFRFDSRLIEFMLLMVNIVFYSMEMRFLMMKDLKLVIGEIGPVEVELSLFIGLLSAYYFGTDGLQKTLGESFAIENEWLAPI